MGARRHSNASGACAAHRERDLVEPNRAEHEGERAEDHQERRGRPHVGEGGIEARASGWVSDSGKSASNAAMCGNLGSIAAASPATRTCVRESCDQLLAGPAARTQDRHRLGC